MGTKLNLVVLICLFSLFSCQTKKDPVEEASKFLNTLPTISHQDMQTAFQQMNTILEYKITNPPTTKNTLQADYETKDHEVYTILASPLLESSAKNEYGISLILLPIKTVHLEAELAHVLNRYEKTTVNGQQVWKINGWLLKIKAPNIITYYPLTTKTIDD